jgi:hypothetical protein
MNVMLVRCWPTAMPTWRAWLRRRRPPRWRLPIAAAKSSVGSSGSMLKDSDGIVCPVKVCACALKTKGVFLLHAIAERGLHRKGHRCSFQRRAKAHLGGACGPSAKIMLAPSGWTIYPKASPSNEPALRNNAAVMAFRLCGSRYGLQT